MSNDADIQVDAPSDSPESMNAGATPEAESMNAGGDVDSDNFRVPRYQDMAKRDMQPGETGRQDEADVLKLNGKHRQLMREMCSGKTAGAAAPLVGMSGETARRISKSKLFQRELTKMHEQIDKLFMEQVAEEPLRAIRIGANEKLHKGADAAVEVLIDGLHVEDQSERRRSAMEILNRIGVSEQKQVKADVTQHITSDAGLEAMIDMAIKSGGDVEGDEDYELTP